MPLVFTVFHLWSNLKVDISSILYFRFPETHNVTLLMALQL